MLLASRDNNSILYGFLIVAITPALALGQGIARGSEEGGVALLKVRVAVPELQKKGPQSPRKPKVRAVLHRVPQG